ncbi:KilA-N domain-containing protein [Laribacter hongkongensis]|nr:KilA-N domain-containing protein [Laribacter hongkongensis]
MQFNPDGWFNATLAAERFGKSPYEWQRLPETVRYMQALEIRYGKIPYVKTSRARADRGGGTWLHPKLAVRFAQWLDVDFAIWCDEQVDALIRGTGDGWEAVRAGAAHQHSALCDMVRLSRQPLLTRPKAHPAARERANRLASASPQQMAGPCPATRSRCRTAGFITRPRTWTPRYGCRRGWISWH